MRKGDSVRLAILAAGCKRLRIAQIASLTPIRRFAFLVEGIEQNAGSRNKRPINYSLIAGSRGE
jgi:hypothetical protein